MLFKVLNEDGTPCNGGIGQWSLPARNDDGTWAPGEWMPAIKGKLIACENGYHLAEDRQVLGWLGPALFEAEYRGERLDADGKVIVREARLLRRFVAWDERTARLFACNCAERALPLYEQEYPDDDRPRRCIEVARQFANDEATEEELAAAARDARDTGAAWAAAGAAAWAAAGAAAWAAWAAAGAAAWAARAARDAAWAAARAAAGAAVREEQYERLLEMLEIAQ